MAHDIAEGYMSETPEEMDDLLFGRWRGTIGPDDAIVCLGDVVLRGLFGRRVGASPGRRILVIGNHVREHRLDSGR